MPSITSAQIRGACGMLGWSMVDLAKAASVSISVVVKAVRGDLGLASAKELAALQAALESAGMEFMSSEDGTGLHLRKQRVVPSLRLV